jgi:hypothetical protein
MSKKLNVKKVKCEKVQNMEKVQNVKNVHFQKIVHILKKCSDYKNVRFCFKKIRFQNMFIFEKLLKLNVQNVENVHFKKLFIF